MRKIIPAIVEEHAEQAAFLWLLRDRSVGAPHVRLVDLARLDERIEAHLDGLRLAGHDGWDTWRDALAAEEPGEIFTRSVLAFESGTRSRVDEIVGLAEKTPALARAVVSALGWLTPTVAQPFIRHFCAAASTPLRRIGIAAAAVHRLNPGPVLEQSLAKVDDAALTSRALRAVGELGLKGLLSAVTPNLEAENDEVRFAAAWSAALLGDASAIRVLGGFAAETGPHAEAACMVGLRCLRPADACRAHQELVGRPELARLAITAAGIIGDPALVEWLLQEMRTPAKARLAGEAFVFITGAGIEHPDLAGHAPEGFPEQPNDDPSDADVTPDLDEHLAWPDQQKLAKWWTAYRSEFRSGTRYLLGNPIAADWLTDVLRGGRQRQRNAAALELALERRGPLFEVRAPGFRQRQLLSS